MGWMLANAPASLRRLLHFPRYVTFRNRRDRIDDNAAISWVYMLSSASHSFT